MKNFLTRKYLLISLFTLLGLTILIFAYSRIKKETIGGDVHIFWIAHLVPLTFPLFLLAGRKWEGRVLWIFSYFCVGFPGALALTGKRAY